jgi:hypothetical protein
MSIEKKFVYETLPLMADIYDEIKDLTLPEARELLRKTVGDNWIERTVENIGKENLKINRPSWYAAFVLGEEGDIGNDEMSKLVEKYSLPHHAIIEIAMYIALHKTNMYEPLLSTKLDYDLIEGKVSIDERNYYIEKQELNRIKSLQSNSEQALKDYFLSIGSFRENMLEIGRRIRAYQQSLKNEEYKD